VNNTNIGEITGHILNDGHADGSRQKLTETMLTLAAAFRDAQALEQILATITTVQDGKIASWQLSALAGMIDALDRQQQPLDKTLDAAQLQKLGPLFSQARGLFADAKAADAERLTALRLLARRPETRQADIQLLTEQLIPQNSAALQSAIVAALGRLDDDQVPRELLSRWTTTSPALRTQSLDVLLSRERWLRLLLKSLQDGAVQGNELDAARRQLLLRHKDASIRDLAAKLLAGATNSDRKKVLDEYQTVTTLPGDRARGKAVFAKRCATCHQLEGVGYAVGPDLGSINNKSPIVLLIAILDPNQAVDNRYLQYVAATKDGRIRNGILVSETANSITIREQEARDTVILRSELDDLRSTGKSLMPEGLEKDLTRQELADVIAYLREAGPPRKQIAGNQPSIIKPAADGSLSLLATTCEIYGGDITFEQPLQNIGYWHGEHDHVLWIAQIEKTRKYDVYLDYACDDAVAGNAFVIEGGEPMLLARVKGTGGWNKYRQVKLGSVTLKAGSPRMLLRPNQPVTGALLDLRGLKLVPAATR
jgi:putative heme-binding domain-containing protein